LFDVAFTDYGNHLHRFGELLLQPRLENGIIQTFEGKRFVFEDFASEDGIEVFAFNNKCRAHIFI